MAMFQGYKKSNRGRIGGNMSRLVVSGGFSPHEEWELDPALPLLFVNPYGSPGQTRVAVGKGMLVSVASDPVYSFERGMYHPALTIADATKGLAPCGMAPYNFCKGADDRFEGNRPTIITRDYIELPWFNRREDAALIKYGAFIGQDLKLNPGYVKLSPTNPGQVELWDPDKDSPYQIVGQILGFNRDAEPWGFFKWVMWDETQKREDDAYINASGKIPNSGDPDKGGNFGWPYDPEYGQPTNGRLTPNGYLSQYTTNPTGMPGLTDGANRQVQRKEFVIAAGTVADTACAWKLDFAPIGNTLDEMSGNISIKIDSVDLTSDQYTYDPATKTVRFVTSAEYADDATVFIQYVCNMIGTPPGWDYEAAVGVVRILLKF